MISLQSKSHEIATVFHDFDVWSLWKNVKKQLRVLDTKKSNIKDSYRHNILQGAKGTSNSA